MEIVDIEGKSENTIILKAQLPVNLLKDAYTELRKLFPLVGEKVRIGDKILITPRLVLNLGKQYYFNGSTEKTKSIESSEHLLAIVEWANENLKDYLNGKKFNSSLLNCYRTKEDHISYHSDSLKQLVKDSPIVTITLMEDSESKPRKFYLKNINTKTVDKFDLTDGLILVMAGKCQKSHQHCVPKLGGVKETQIKGRISITLRCLED